MENNISKMSKAQLKEIFNSKKHVREFFQNKELEYDTKFYPDEFFVQYLQHKKKLLPLGLFKSLDLPYLL